MFVIFAGLFVSLSLLFSLSCLSLLLLFSACFQQDASSLYAWSCTRFPLVKGFSLPRWHGLLVKSASDMMFVMDLSPTWRYTEATLLFTRENDNTSLAEELWASPHQHTACHQLQKRRESDHFQGVGFKRPEYHSTVNWHIQGANVYNTHNTHNTCDSYLTNYHWNLGWHSFSMNLWVDICLLLQAHMNCPKVCSRVHVETPEIC